jgi:hypothetical protein
VACAAAQTRRGVCRAEEAARAHAGRDVEDGVSEARSDREDGGTLRRAADGGDQNRRRPLSPIAGPAEDHQGISTRGVEDAETAPADERRQRRVPDAAVRRRPSRAAGRRESDTNGAEARLRRGGARLQARRSRHPPGARERDDGDARRVPRRLSVPVTSRRSDVHTVRPALRRLPAAG